MSLINKPKVFYKPNSPNAMKLGTRFIKNLSERGIVVIVWLAVFAAASVFSLSCTRFKYNKSTSPDNGGPSHASAKPELFLPKPGDITSAKSGDVFKPWDEKDIVVTKFIKLTDSLGGSYESIGKSSTSPRSSYSKPWDIVLFKYGNPTKPAILVDAHMHGNEFHGYEVLYTIIKWLLSGNDDYAKNILENNYILVIPCLNYRWSRGNFNIDPRMTVTGPSDLEKNGVNLNRNFGPRHDSTFLDKDSYGGKFPDSENESKALISAWEKYHPKVYWNLHQGAVPYTSCTASTPVQLIIANKIKDIYGTIQGKLGVDSVNMATFRISNHFSTGLAVSGASSMGSVGFLTEVYKSWRNYDDIRSSLNNGLQYKQYKALFIASCLMIQE